MSFPGAPTVPVLFFSCTTSLFRIYCNLPTSMPTSQNQGQYFIHCWKLVEKFRWCGITSSELLGVYLFLCFNTPHKMGYRERKGRKKKWHRLEKKVGGTQSLTNRKEKKELQSQDPDGQDVHTTSQMSPQPHPHTLTWEQPHCLTIRET